MVPVLIRPDGNMILTRWPSSRSIGECGTKTRWGPLYVLHDLTLGAKRRRSVICWHVIKFNRWLSFHRDPNRWVLFVLAGFPRLQSITYCVTFTLWATITKLVVSTEAMKRITGCLTNCTHNCGHLITLQSPCAGTWLQRDGLIG